MDKIDEIQSVLLKSNRVSHKHALTIARLLIAVANGYKVGFIWDIGPPVTIHKVAEIVEELRQQKIVTVDVLTVGVAQEICVLNKTKFLENSQQFSTIIFIDVTKTLSQPQLLPATQEPSLLSMVEDVCEQIQSATAGSLVLKVPEDVYCVPTIIGLLAGYPLVYWYQPSDGDTQCLSGIDLQVFRMMQGKDTISSFSCPKNLADEPQVKKCLEAWRKTVDQSKDFHVETIVSKNEFTVNL